jgi:hypothetical protein
MRRGKAFKELSVVLPHRVVLILIRHLLLMRERVSDGEEEAKLIWIADTFCRIPG